MPAPQSLVTLCVASTALFAGNCMVPIAFKQLMGLVPAEHQQLWAVLHPVHGIIVYSLILIVFRRAALPSLRSFNPLLALPVSLLFGIYNAMKASVGKSVPGTVQLLLDQLAPLGVMTLCVGLRLTTSGSDGSEHGIWRGFSRFAAAKEYRPLHVLSALVLIAGTVAYAALELTSAATSTQPAANGAGATDGMALFVCAAKLVPFCVGFVYVEFVLQVVHPHLFPTVMWWWICAFQMVVALATSACSLEALRAGVSCFWFGHDYAPASAASGDRVPQVACAPLTPLLNFVGAGGSSLVNIAIPLVARHGSSALVTLIRGASLPVVSLLFSYERFGGERLDAKVGTGVACATLAVALWAVAGGRAAAAQQGGVAKKLD